MRALALLYRRQRRPSAYRASASTPADAYAGGSADWDADDAALRGCRLAPAKWVVLGAGRTGPPMSCASMTYPLVVKVLPSDAEHKTEMGLVKLRVRSAGEVDAMQREFRARMGKPEAGILVQEMVEEGVEVVVSCLRGTDFGPVVSIGTGGVAIELLPRHTNLALPVSEEQVLAALRKLKLWTLLQGFRGKPAADVEALARAVVRFGDIFWPPRTCRSSRSNPVTRVAGRPRLERSRCPGDD